MLSDMKGSNNPFQKKPSKWRIAGMGLVLLIVLFQWFRPMILPHESQLRQAVHQAVQARFPEPARNLADRLGIHPFGGDLQTGDQNFRGRVILIHGLDDPGIMWKDLGPVLQANQYQVLVMSYPNDQAVHASSRFFFDHMRNLAVRDPAPVSLVGHSMGGLVARDMLTRPDLDFSGAAAAGEVPPVRQLILLGTPNQGAPLVRFRIITEIRDQIYQLSVPESHWLHCLLDGTGAAGADLLPGSRFLTRLNHRPVPADVPMTIIAGMIFFSEKPSVLKEMLGDGLVSVAATRLGQVPVIRVPGTHFSMIRNLFRSSERMPPAIPVILALLESSGKEPAH
jgi:pimeloyl-ACP methyl ester carboxylesterase